MKQQDKIKLYEALDKNDVTKKIKYRKVDKETTRADTKYTFGDYELIFSQYTSIRFKKIMWIIEVKWKSTSIAYSSQAIQPDKELYSLYVAVRNKSMGKEYKNPFMSTKTEDFDKSDMRILMVRFNTVMSYELPRMLPSEFVPYTQEITDKLGADLMKIILQYKVRTK